MKVELGANFKIDLNKLIETKLLIQANSGGGKSYAIRKLLETTHGHVQQIVIDPEGEFFTLRQKYDYVLAAPKSKECVADLRSASKLAIRLLELGTSAIIDIFELGIHRKLFVKKFCEALVNAPRELWRPVIVVIDEAHIFCPEAGEGTAESKEAVTQLASLGRKRGFCAVLATQRIAKLDKDAAAECNNVMIGRCAVDVDRKRAAKDIGFTNKDEILGLRNLKGGQFYVFGPAISDDVRLIQVGEVVTKHLKAGQRSAKKPAPSAKVKAVLASLADLPHEAEEEAKTFADLQARYRELEAQAKLLQVKADRTDKRVEVQTKTIERPVFRKGEIDKLERMLQKIASGQSELAQLNADFLVASTCVYTAALAATQKPVESPKAPMILPVKMPKEAPPKTVFTNGHAKPPIDSSSLPEGEAKILRAILQGITNKKAISAITGYKRPTRNTYLSKLTSRGLIESPRGDDVSATDAGRAALPDFEPLPTGAALRDWWLGKLPVGEAKILEALIAAYPNKLSKEDVSAQTGYERPTRNTYISKLRGRQIIDDERGFVGARSTLFD